MLYDIHEKIKELESKGKKIIKFNVGDPDQATDKRIVKAAFEAIANGKTKYGSSFGDYELRKKLADMHNVNIDNVIITPGSKWAIFATMYLLLKEGDNVIIPSPHYTTYELIAKQLKAEIKLLECSLDNDWKIKTDELENLIDNKTKLIILNNPNNPTSKIISKNTLENIIEIANRKNVKILSDEAYSDIAFFKTTSILDIDKDHIFINTFSKTFAMTGWRIGYTIMNKELVSKIATLNQITITNVPLFIQVATLRALKYKKEISSKIRNIYKKRADFACKILSKTNLKFSNPDAPFYIFPYCGMDSEKLTSKLLQKSIAIVPGIAFGDYKEYFRLALTLPDTEIRVGLNKLVEALI